MSLSPFNRLNDNASDLQSRGKILLHDVTLRDGEQSPGVVFDVEDKLRIARALDDLGVHRIEAGFPVISASDREGVAAVAAAGLRAEVWGFGRCLPGDVDINAECGVRHMILEIAVSEVKMQAYGADREGVVRKMRLAIERAKELGLYVAFMPVDLTRADVSFAETVITQAVEQAGADEVVVVDTIGVASPEGIGRLTELIRSWVDVPLAVHCHNDFGLALANTLSSLKAGAHCAHVSVNCLGERAGNVDLAEVVMALELLYGLPMNMRLDRLVETAKLVEQISGYPLALNKPVVGERIFMRESGGVVQQLLQAPESVEPYEPALVGQRRAVVLGKKSGRYSVHHALERLGMEATEQEVDDALVAVKEISRRNRRLVDDAELQSIVHDMRDGNLA